MIYCYCGNAKTILNKKYKSFSHIDEKKLQRPSGIYCKTV